MKAKDVQRCSALFKGKLFVLYGLRLRKFQASKHTIRVKSSGRNKSCFIVSIGTKKLNLLLQHGPGFTIVGNMEPVLSSYHDRAISDWQESFLLSAFLLVALNVYGGLISGHLNFRLVSSSSIWLVSLRHLFSPKG